MAKYKIYTFTYLDDTYEGDTMKDCVHQYYIHRVPLLAADAFDARFEAGKNGWVKYFQADPRRIVEFEVEGG